MICLQKNAYFYFYILCIKKRQMLNNLRICGKIQGHDVYACLDRNCVLENKVLHMCFERFLLAFESRDLSQADKRITRVSSFPSFNFWMINYSYTQKSYLALWQNCFGQFITQKFPSLKSKQFSQFFLVRGKSERIDKI